MLFLFSIAIFTACKKDKKEEQTDECQIGTSKLTASINGQSWCANQTLFADEAIVLTINGMRNDGSTLTLEIDNFMPGIYVINADTNHILYTTSTAIGYESTSDNPGTLTIIENDQSNNRLKADFTVILREPLAGNSISVSGNVNVVYAE